MERYMKILKSYKGMPPALETALRENVYPLQCKKGEIIQEYGTITDNLYFVENGVFQYFMPRDKSKITLRFKIEDEFIISLWTIYGHPTVPKGIEALKDGMLWCFPRPFIEDMSQKFPEFLDQFDAIIRNDWMAVEKSGLCSDPEKGTANYQSLRSIQPELLTRVPIPYLANYTHIPENVFRHLHDRNIKLNVSTVRRRRSK